MKSKFGILLSSALFLAASGAVAQQATKIPRIGFLAVVSNPESDEPFRKGLRELGYVEGKNIYIEFRYAGGRVERLPELAAELVALKVDVIVAGSTQTIEVARRATKTIPIVFPITFDPVESGFVASLARPGGNLTGLSLLSTVTTAKRVELLKDVIPRISRMAVLTNPTNPGTALALKHAKAAAKRLGIRLQILEVRSADGVEAAFQAAAKERAGALLVLGDFLFRAERERLFELGIKHRLPEIFYTSEEVEAGGLMSYGAKIGDMYHRAAVYVDKILKGAKPADLPVEQATKFELVINLKTARQIGLTIPKEVLFRADKVIE